VSALEESWIIELHPLGGSQMRQARDLMRENLKLYAEGKKPEWVPVAMRPTFAEARAALADVRRENRKQQSRASEDAVETGAEDRKETP
jgi:hypothetical protein